MYPIEKYQFKVFEHKNEDGTKSSVVIALSTFAGKAIKGTAKCVATDPFDLEKGTQLAAARCDHKVCLKRLKRAKYKYNETAKEVDSMIRKLQKMNAYCQDAEKEYRNACDRLKAIESALK